VDFEKGLGTTYRRNRDLAPDSTRDLPSHLGGRRNSAAIQTTFVGANVSAFLYWIGAENASTSHSALINLDGNSYIASKRL
jgi:hypothetical protein